MSSFAPGFPEASEHSAGLSGYLGKARGVTDPIGALAAQLDEVKALLGPLDASKQDHRYAEGKWTIKEVLGHLIDCERVFAYRALRIARNDKTPLPGFDENLFAAESDHARCDWAELLEEFAHVRRASISMLRHLPKEAWTRTGTSNDSPLSTRAVAFVMIGHVTHHLDIVRERYLDGR